MDTYTQQARGLGQKASQVSVGSSLIPGKNRLNLKLCSSSPKYLHVTDKAVSVSSLLFPLINVGIFLLTAARLTSLTAEYLHTWVMCMPFYFILFSFCFLFRLTGKRGGKSFTKTKLIRKGFKERPKRSKMDMALVLNIQMRPLSSSIISTTGMHLTNSHT